MNLDNREFKEEVKSNRPQTQSAKNAKAMIDNVQNSLEPIQVAFGSSGVQNILGSSALNSSADNDLFQETHMFKVKKGKKMADDIDEDPFDPASLNKQSIVEPVDVNSRQDQDEIENNEKYFDFTNESNEKELLKQFQRFVYSDRQGESDSGSEFQGMQSNMYQEDNGFGGAIQESSLRRMYEIVQFHIFKINYVLLSYSFISNAIYHIFLIIEFFQMYFLANYGWDVKNGFEELQQSTINVDGYIPKLLSQRSGDLLNRTQETQSLKVFLQLAQTIEIKDTVWRMDEQVKFANPALYILSAGNKDEYLTAYWVMSAIFYALVAVLIIFGKNLYNHMMNSVLTEGFKILVKVLSFILVVFMTILQIPFYTLLLQSFNCEEDSLIDYTIQDISCSGSDRSILVPFSIVTLLCYIIIIALQASIFQETKFHSTLPWAGYDRQTSILRTAIKLALTAGFVFDKSANYRPIVMYGCTVIFLFILYRRFVDSNYFNRWINFAINTYDIFIAYHLVFIASHIVSKFRYGVPNVVVFIFSALLFAALYESLLLCKNMRMLDIKTYLYKASSIKCEIYLQKYFQKVERADFGDQFFFFGSLFTHIEECDDYKCECRKIASILEGLNKFQHYKKKIAQLSDGEWLEKNMSFKEAQEEGKGIIVEDVEKIHVSQDPTQKNWYEGKSSTKDYFEGPVRSQSFRKIEKDNKLEEKALEAFEEVFGHSIEQESHQNKYNGGQVDVEIEHVKNIQRQSFKFMAVLLTKVVQRFPKDACHRLHLAGLFLKNGRNRIGAMGFAYSANRETKLSRRDSHI
ncbi:hypothetical protein FGO68_gene423 [Halteria grandinella]|uniref:Transmembrane protein n=1 Tax=Halteria grandinella TaxID=5974 RepID=A0A8J8NGQ9_HALGN|nr:hypothetical protein FGO68_gene423 [Halteria grandinella]